MIVIKIIVNNKKEKIVISIAKTKNKIYKQKIYNMVINNCNYEQ